MAPTVVSGLENPMDRRTWWAAVHEVAKSQTRPSIHTQRQDTCLETEAPGSKT